MKNNDAFVEKFLAGFDDSRYPDSLLQDYELIECLAHNEMGETLLVRDRETGDHYVAKCYADKTLLSRTSESALLKNLHREGLPAFAGDYRNENMICVVRGFVDGRPLDKLVRETPLTVRQSLDIVVQLCDILTYLHGQTPPVIHRDIKPQNIIVDAQGRVTLIDFGISRTYDETSQEDTLPFGTRHFAAPEQYGFSQTDPRSDIFSLGILLCWLLAGTVDIEQAKKAIPDRRLAAIIAKCTAFDPKDRYKKAAQVKDALTGRAKRRRALAIIPAFLLILGAGLYFGVPWATKLRQPAGITFQEPLIEEAVRLSLGKDENAILTEQDLLSVNEIYVLGENAAADYETLNELVDDFANGDSQVRGSIEDLEDIKKLKNIRWISLVYQNISDLSPLSGLVSLENLDLRNNPMLDDLSPLSGLTSLSSLVIFDTGVSDLSVLRDCPRLTLVDIGNTPITSPAALDGLDSLQTLVIRKASLETLEGIESHPLLENIYLSETLLNDLSPLLNLPRLQTVEVSESMHPAVEALASQAQFEIIYQ